MQIYSDFHTHTFASDGRQSVREDADAAIARGLKRVAITDHGVSSILCHLTAKKFTRQSEEIKAINAEGKIEVLHGAEANLLNFNGDIDLPEAMIRECEVLHIGFHRFISAKYLKGGLRYVLVNGFLSEKTREKLRERNTAAYLAAMDRYPVDVLVHLNHRALVDTARVCERAKERGVYVELNAKHIGTLEKDIDKVLASGVKLILGSDAHKSANVGKFDKVEAFVKKHGIDENRIYGVGENVPAFKDKSGYTALRKEV